MTSQYRDMNIDQIGSYRRRQFQPKREERGNAFSMRVVEERLGNVISECSEERKVNYQIKNPPGTEKN